MAKRLFDAVVIGAGPSGSTAARLLARSGWRVLLTDRNPAGAGRVCGGFLGPEARLLWKHISASNRNTARCLCLR